MKKICLLIFLLAFFLTSCAPGGGNMSILEQDDNIIANKTFEKVIDMIKEQDECGLKSLFAKKIQNSSSELKNSVMNLIQFVQGNSVSFSDAAEAGVGADYKTERGKKIKAIQSAFTYETDTHKYYFAIKECTRDDFDNDNIGVISIYIIKSEDWKEDYIYRGDGKWTPGIMIDN